MDTQIIRLTPLEKNFITDLWSEHSQNWRQKVVSLFSQLLIDMCFDVKNDIQITNYQSFASNDDLIN